MLAVTGQSIAATTGDHWKTKRKARTSQSVRMDSFAPNAGGLGWTPFKNTVHPTQKPVELARKAINNSSKAGDAVLDLFNGSGSTLIACEQTGRVGYGCELAPQYVDATIRRWQHLTGRQALLNGATLDEVEVQRTKGASRKAKK